MAYDEDLAGRIRLVLTSRCAFAERKMFGGLAFMIEGHMGCGVVGGDLMLRVGPDGYQDALARPHARPMDFTGRPLTGMVYVAPAGFRTERALENWIGRALTFIQSLPAREAKKATRSPRARR
jgi:TfoX/Sxy family transcriptional regulator of competence genes